MNARDIDFAPRTLGWHLANAKGWHWGVATLALVVLGLAFGTLWAFEGQASRWRAEAAQLREQLQARLPSAVRRNPANEVLPPAPQLAQVNAAVQQLNIPWTELLDALESAKGKSVALLELVPEAGAARLRGSAEVRNERDMVTFIRRLKKQDLVADAQLLSHQVNEQDRNKPIRFEFSLRWREF